MLQLNVEAVAGLLVRKFGWEEERTARAFNVLENTATVIDPPLLPEVIPGGHSDNRVLECSVATNADYLVTGAIFWPSGNMRRRGYSMLNASCHPRENDGAVF